MSRSARVQKLIDEAAELTPAERNELAVELTRPARSSTGADLLAVWHSMPHDDPSWADDVEKAYRSQPSIADEPSPWER
jgi:hypothetical protein